MRACVRFYGLEEDRRVGLQNCFEVSREATD